MRIGHSVCCCRKYCGARLISDETAGLTQFYCLDLNFCQTSAACSPVSKVYIIFCVIFCCDTVLPTGTTFKFLSLHTGVFSLKMVTMRSQDQHLPPLHHAQCPLQATLHLPVQQPLIYFCRGFRSSAQIGTFIHT